MADDEIGDSTDISEIVYSDPTAVETALSSAITVVDSNDRTTDADNNEDTNNEERCKSFPPDAMRRLQSTEFEVSTELNDEFYSRLHPGRRMYSLPIL